MDRRDELTEYLEELDNKNKRINVLKNVKVIEVYEVLIEGMFNIEIVYQKNSTAKTLTIKSKCHFGPMYEGCWFEFGLEPLSQILDKKKTLSTRLSDIDFIETTNIYGKELDNGGHLDLEILYKNKKGERHTYLLHTCEHEDDYEVHDVKLLNDVKSTYDLIKG